MFKSKDKNCKSCDKGCSSCQRYQEKALELEVDEELRQDKLNEFWKKYRYIICGAIFLVLAITAATEIYQTWWAKVRLSESDTFEQGVVAAYSGDYEKSRPYFQQLAKDGKTGYRYLAQIELAGLALQHNDKEQALSLLKAVMDSSAPKALRSVATLSYVGNQMDTMDSAQALSLLKPLLAETSFVVPASQLAVAVYMKSDQKDQAKALLDQALKLPDLTAEAKNKLETLQTMIGQ
ncbi:MAG: tetratricopeptide repeat protein [Alphaproteobacteria bacterium]|nr:tetratricopeptide repeat protein [Alphaproteobacteria bacterium]